MKPGENNKPGKNLLEGGGDNCRNLLIDIMAHRHKIFKVYNIV